MPLFSFSFPKWFSTSYRHLWVSISNPAGNVRLDSVGNSRGDAMLQPVIAQPDGIKGAICQQVPSRPVLQRGPGLAQVVGLSRH